MCPVSPPVISCHGNVVVFPVSITPMGGAVESERARKWCDAQTYPRVRVCVRVCVSVTRTHTVGEGVSLVPDTPFCAHMHNTHTHVCTAESLVTHLLV